MSRYAVVGHPVAHSQSPFIHAAFAAQTGEPVVYERLLCPLDGFTAAVRVFAAGGASGCNVTMPFKFEAFERVAKTTPRARIAAACNTLRFDADGWLGDNTDGAGLVRDIERNAGVDLHGTRVLLIGAGGGAAGALGPLLSSGASEVVVANRSVDKARVLVERHVQALGAAASASRRAAPLDDCGEALRRRRQRAAPAASHGAARAGRAERAAAAAALALDMMYGPAAARLPRLGRGARRDGPRRARHAGRAGRRGVPALARRRARRRRRCCAALRERIAAP